MLAVEPGATGPALAAWSRSLGRKPGAILVVSPHWMGHGLALSTRDRQVAWHDFGGFPPELYTLQYAAPGSPALAARTQALLAEAGIAADRDPRRPLDHGAWVPLRYLYPEVDVPVVQLSLDMGRDAAGQLELGRALVPLRDEDVLIIGSGSLTHNLRDVRMPRTRRRRLTCRRSRHGMPNTWPPTTCRRCSTGRRARPARRRPIRTTTT